MSNSKKYLVLLTLPILFGCATAAQKQELALKRATFDLDCASEKLTAVELSPNTYGISGCGKKGTYLIDCPRGHGYNPSIAECNAILNSPKNATPAEK